MLADPFAEWSIKASDYPRLGSAAQRMQFLLGYAVLAPSSHNTQPWLFRLLPEGVELIADRTRCLPVVDPFDRALVISCGAALGHLCTAMRFFGHRPEIALLPEAADPDLLARVSFGPSEEAPEIEVARFHAITKRRTTRLRFADEHMPDGLKLAIRSSAAAAGVELAVLDDPERKSTVASLVAAGDRAQFADPAFRRELGSWVHSRRAATRDGMSGAAFGMPDLLSSAGGLVIRTFDMGDGQGARDEAVAAGSPALLVLATAGDGPVDWLHTGMALSSVLLDVAAAGWTSAYLNQPVETASLRPELRVTAGVAGFPQLLIRIGRAAVIPPAVRRPVANVLIDKTRP